MGSLVILMIEAEQPEGLSARKLVVETVKHNVLTAYNADDGLDLLRRFPNVDIVLVHGSLISESHNILSDVKAHAPGKPIVVACPLGDMSCPEADFIVDSHQPQELLLLLTREFAMKPRP